MWFCVDAFMIYRMHLLCDLRWIISSFVTWLECNTAAPRGCEQSGCLFNGCLTVKTADHVRFGGLSSLWCHSFLVQYLSNDYFHYQQIFRFLYDHSHSYLGNVLAKKMAGTSHVCFKKEKHCFLWLFCWLTSHFSSLCDWDSDSVYINLMSLHNLRTLSRSVNQK